VPYAIDLTIEHPLDPSVEPSLLIALAQAALRSQDAPDGSVGIVIADDATVQNLNCRYRGLDERLMSSPSASAASPAPPQRTSRPSTSSYPSPRRVRSVRSLTYPYAARTALATARPIRDELALLTVHGVLHLLGHDHYERDRLIRCNKRSERILSGFGIDR
jgi:probable rRNA maturation factor